ncbi:UNKNOWN [Stylonychia lemnae]|uniref:Uncharacterized protein n=1 Tax=Stylonychia lemnae TaxID=5949 RepID=A0A078AAZ1_STYLE|nr:UNKNOWN [Stylonychia lemnae]|eukprot:CDW79425.1 UNKNOWN [Stylonychia lemnae]
MHMVQEVNQNRQLRNIQSFQTINGQQQQSEHQRKRILRKQAPKSQFSNKNLTVSHNDFMLNKTITDSKLDSTVSNHSPFHYQNTQQKSSDYKQTIALRKQLNSRNKSNKSNFYEPSLNNQQTSSKILYMDSMSNLPASLSGKNQSQNSPEKKHPKFVSKKYLNLIMKRKLQREQQDKNSQNMSSALDVTKDRQTNCETNFYESNFEQGQKTNDRLKNSNILMKSQNSFQAADYNKMKSQNVQQNTLPIMRLRQGRKSMSIVHNQQLQQTQNSFKRSINNKEYYE